MFLYALTHLVKVVHQLVVRVRLTPKDQNMDLTNTQEAILQQINAELIEKGLSDDVKFSWKEQPNGKIFFNDENFKLT
ncbi:hypothetical protein UPYG_G00236330 [Umbra pygmaea]|uniref:Uncharacterized protein n=1 Tax=Umbra pygmaea TaxID=75934 RepID=A0ABD0WED9_UMBPY